jgi:hypothetical protein
MSRVKRHKLKKSVVKHTPKKEKVSKKMIWTLIIGGLMIASVFGIMFSSYNSDREQLDYGDYRFQRTSSGWSIDVNSQRVDFTYFPADLEDMNISREVADKIMESKVVYITFNPNIKRVQNFELMRYELANVFGQALGIYAMPGITEENDDYAQPVVNCENATAILPVIRIVAKNETEATTAYLDGDCIVLKADEYSTMLLKDRLLYGMLGIIE